MPQLLALALVGGVVYYGYRVFKKEMQRVAAELDAAEEQQSPKKVTILHKDEDGVYRPKQD